MKDYASRQRSPRKHLMGLGTVAVLHALMFWAISSGLAHKFVKIVKGPVEAVLLEETKPDIPPPPPPPDDTDDVVANNSSTLFSDEDMAWYNDIKKRSETHSIPVNDLKRWSDMERLMNA